MITRMKVSVPYDHDPADHQTIFMAVLPVRQEPSAKDWKPVFRDMAQGRKVVWIKANVDSGWVVWLRDKTGVREVTPIYV
jgi:hypothetical protein